MEGSTWQSWKDPRFTLRANAMLSPYCCVAWELEVPCVFLLWTRCSSEARHCFSISVLSSEVFGGGWNVAGIHWSVSKEGPYPALEISRDSSLQLFLQDHLRFWGKVTFHLNILSQGQNQQWQLVGHFSSYMVSSQWLRKMVVGGPSHFYLLANLGSEPSMG